ncbi:MAG: hypothetical protein J7M12_02615, partial [Candidatus Hydrogenedentes bacterium]|nr:hypothetical protein [Candidatus Hydrogenedentota bacterium]
PWPLLSLTVLGLAWCFMGLMGRRKNKGLAALGLALNIVPFVLAVVVGITGWEKKAPKEDPLSGLTEQQLIEIRQQKQQEIMNELRKARGLGPQQVQQPPVTTAPPVPPPPAGTAQ